MWDRLVEYLVFIDGFTLGLNILALCLYVMFVRFNTAFVLIVASGVALDLFHQILKIYLKSLFHFTEYLHLINVAWYLSFAITDLIFIAAMLHVIKTKNLIRDRASDLMLVGYMALACLQVFRYTDRIAIGTDVLGPFYSTGVVMINVTVSCVLLLHALRSIYVTTGSKVAWLINR
ncbi:hypothetical protein LJ739_06895 [Aestuariibacter halophilus]|uniref:Uncharacterized protein n=1 Tax=Fluctibacter halophilus TaxID=226011 RepID=A0ABS8G644_9ALTE|nr:hypothetical protein [Aestuariibacter halophilus]MCC2615964.1 hypothetical protein [Aestuariibacter halophilus]